MGCGAGVFGRVGAAVLFAALGGGGAHAAPAGSNSPDASAASNDNAAAPGGGGSAAGVAQKQGATAKPLGTPGTITLVPGVDLTATYISESAGNPTGGIKQGAAYAGQVFGGLDFDMKTLAGIDGGTVHFAMVERTATAIPPVSSATTRRCRRSTANRSGA